MPSIDERIALGAGVRGVITSSGSVWLLKGRRRVPLGRATQSTRALLRDLSEGDVASQDRGHEIWPLLVDGWLAVTITRDGDAMYTMHPLRSPGRQRPAKVPATAVLSRFAIMRKSSEGITIESPLAWCRVEVRSRALSALARALDMGEPAGDHLEERLRQDLAWGGLLVDDPATERDTFRLSQWNTHDLWFHERTRFRESSTGYGGTGWADGRFDPVPAERPQIIGERILLHRPDLDQLRRTDLTLTAALENRTSIRAHDDDSPLKVDAVGEFLYRCARTRRKWARNGLELLSRPYPGGGSLYELEIYPVVRYVDGLEPGLYHYDAQEHALVSIHADGEQVSRMLALAGASAGVSDQPQLLMVITARFGRVMWKYEQLAYSLILKDVGVLYQVMYLVATAMGLAPCALGTGDSVAFAEATGIDSLEESNVGEFMLGGYAPNKSGESDACGPG